MSLANPVVTKLPNLRIFIPLRNVQMSLPQKVSPFIIIDFYTNRTCSIYFYALLVALFVIS